MKYPSIAILFCILIGTSSCAPSVPSDIDEPAPIELTANSDPCVQDIMNNVPEEYSRCSRQSSASDPAQSQASNLLCANTASYAGKTVTCTITRAYCSYHPATNGSPTFCNDAPYPNNNFTLVAWDDDWSDYDGKCIVVSGLISIYNGKPQIEAYSRAAVSPCP